MSGRWVVANGLIDSQVFGSSLGTGCDGQNNEDTWSISTNTTVAGQTQHAERLALEDSERVRLVIRSTGNPLKC